MTVLYLTFIPRTVQYGWPIFLARCDYFAAANTRLYFITIRDSNSNVVTVKYK